MIKRILESLGNLYFVEHELKPSQYSRSYLLREKQSDARRFLSILPQDISSQVEDVKVFLGSLEQYFSLDSTFIEIDQSGSIPEGSLYWLSTSLPSDVLPIQEQLNQQGLFSASQISYIGAVCCRALTTLHNSSRTHGGLVPTSLLISAQKIYISDTGVFAALQTVKMKVPVFQGLEIRYMSPEQSLAGQASIQSDIYSLGAVLYELLTGKLPFGGRTTAAVMASVLVDEAAPGVTAGGRKSGPVTSAILRAIEKSPLDRWTSAQQFEQALTKGSTPHADKSIPPNTRPRVGCLPIMSAVSLISIYTLYRFLT